jgi:hypothetical protein
MSDDNHGLLARQRELQIEAEQVRSEIGISRVTCSAPSMSESGPQST